MLKYFKRQKSHRRSCRRKDDNDDNVDDVDDVDAVNCSQSTTTERAAKKRHSLRSTLSFCDEIFLDELAALGSGVDADEDSVSCGALSLGALSNLGPAAAAVAGAVDEDLFRYHSRLSMTITAIVSEPDCLTYFVQYLEQRNALSLIKFYLDIENFKTAAVAQLRKEDERRTKKLYTDLQGPEEAGAVSCSTSGANDVGAVPELRTLCDATMRQPLTDDEKSQIYAETSKQLTKCSPNKPTASSELSLCSESTNVSDKCPDATAHLSEASVRDALAIYQKYLISDAKHYVPLPVDIISKVSLTLCKKPAERAESDAETHSIPADCFTEAQSYVLDLLEKDFLNDFLQSTYYSKYCLELMDSTELNICDILFSEVALFYFMEYLEQRGERSCLDFWTLAINFRKSFICSQGRVNDEREAQSNAMIIYEKFFSLQAEPSRWSSHKLRSHVELSICAGESVLYCFDLPLRVVARYLERKYLQSFLKSQLFGNYLNELRTRIQTEDPVGHNAINNPSNKLPLHRSCSEKSQTRNRKSLASNCASDKRLTISQKNTLLASMDVSTNRSLKQFELNIDSNELTNPDLLWHRSNGSGSAGGGGGGGGGLKFGRVNSLGRYERDFVSPSDALNRCSAKHNNNWSLSLDSNRIKNAVRKLVHLPQDHVQEEIAWQVAEMIVKDVTDVTLRNGGEHMQKAS